MSNIKKATAEASINIDCHCPYCGMLIDVYDEVHDYLGDDLRASNLKIEITCELCDEVFIIDKVTL